jgi:spore germination protein KA
LFSSFFSKRKAKKKSRIQQQEQQDLKGYENQELSRDLKQNIQSIKSTLGKSSDLVTREFRIGQGGKIHVAAIYTDGLADQTTVSNFVMKVLMIETREADLDRLLKPQNVLQVLKEQALTLGDVKEIQDWKQLYLSVVSGDTVLIIDGLDKAIAASTKGWENRGVTEPSSQTVIRGPREGFSESIRTNTALIRRKIRSPRLWLEQRQIGEVTQTEVGIMYIKGIVNDKVVQEVRERLDRIKIDGILESGYIEELIQDETLTPFPTMYNTERPDVIAAGLLEGRVAILIDGTPFVLLVPMVFVGFFQSAEDYYQRYDIGNFLRVLRYIAFFMALLVPSLYVAIITYHQEMIPTTLVISLAAQREGVPFPAFIEAIIMELTFEILREAGVRMPRAIGSAISIVGALVIGESAVAAGLISPAMVIVVSITAIASFVSPAFNLAIAVRMLRFGFLILAAVLGLYGIVVALLILVLHLCSLRSFGVPYLTPMAPFIAQDQKDTIFRFPIWAMFTRPRLLNQKNTIRQGINQKPQKPPGDQARDQKKE